MPATQNIYHLSDNEIALLKQQRDDSQTIDRLKTENRLLKAKVVLLITQLEDAYEVLDKMAQENGQ